MELMRGSPGRANAPEIAKQVPNGSETRGISRVPGPHKRGSVGPNLDEKNPVR